MKKNAVSIIFSVLLLIFALLQLNDPDPQLWVLIYVVGAYFCLANTFGITLLRLIFMTGYILFLIITLYKNWPTSFEGFSQDLQYPNLNIEKARESGGVVISLIFVLISAFLHRRNKSA